MEEETINEFEAESQADRDQEETLTHVTDLSEITIEPTEDNEGVVIRVTK